jgi:hypothetical protein
MKYPPKDTPHLLKVQNAPSGHKNSAAKSAQLIQDVFEAVYQACLSKGTTKQVGHIPT